MTSEKVCIFHYYKGAAIYIGGAKKADSVNRFLSRAKEIR